MNKRNTVLLVLVVVVAVALIWSMRNRQQAPAPETAAHPMQHADTPAARPAPAPAPVPHEDKVPPFYPSAEAAAAAGALPKTLPPERYFVPAVARAYAAAREIPGVLAQQPCYCWCDKFGHGSLLDCFATDHGAT